MDDRLSRDKHGDHSNRDLSALALAGLGVQFAVALLFFVFAGNWVDQRFGSSPIALLVGVFVGGGGTFFLKVRQLMRGVEQAEQAARRARESERL